MRFLLTLAFSLVFIVLAYSQNVGIGTTNPDSSAVLEISALDKGMLLPRMDSTHRKNIINPKDGLILYDSTTYSFWFFRDTIWTEFHWEDGDNLGNHIATEDLDMGGQLIKNLGFPAIGSDAVTKSYVDSEVGILEVELNNIEVNHQNQIDNNVVSISNNTLDINSHTTNDNDLSPTNELQSLSIAGQNLTLSSGNTVTLPSNTGVFENISGLIRNTGANTDDFVFGYTQLPPIGINITESLFLFDENKGALRAGSLLNSDVWGSNKIGNNSIAFGLNPEASGVNSLAFGENSKATGTNSIAMGYRSEGNGDFSTALGWQTEANGAYTTSAGIGTCAASYGSTAIGRYNVVTGDGANWISTDPIFEIGIGTNTTNRENAVTVLKNGTISFKEFTFPNSDGTANQVMQTDGAGNITWVTPMSGADNLGNHFATQDLDMDGQRITNLDDPTLSGDAATKLYVDLLINPVQNDVSDNSSDIASNVVDITNNSTLISNHTVNDNDLSATNELQTLSVSGQELSLSSGNTITLPSNSGVFENNAGLVSNSGNNATDDFIFGSNSMPLNGANTSDTLFFFDKSKAAFRFGTLDNSTNWSTDSMGVGSVALGLNSLAIGDVAISMGFLTKAKGTLSFAQGSGTLAKEIHSIAMGYQSQALGNSAIALGNSNIAKGNESFVVGFLSEANGASSTAIGKFAISDAFGSMAIGSFNEGGGDPSNWVMADPILEVGIGLDAMNKKNALTVLKDGTISFRQYTFPNMDGSMDQFLQTDGSGNLSWSDQTPVVFENDSGVVRNKGTNTDDFVFGAMGLPQNGSSASGRLFFFDDSKGAFRAGELVNSDVWTPNKMGDFSAAFGSNTEASGDYSFAAGNGTKAIGAHSTAFGLETEASGLYSIAAGIYSKATGNFSTALGHSTEASGMFSTAMGHSTVAIGSYSTAFGDDTEASGSYSTAMGFSTAASGSFSTSMGRLTQANGIYSTAMGRSSQAIGENSTAMGSSTQAIGENSTAMGEFSEAHGEGSITSGFSTKASGKYSTAFGSGSSATGGVSSTMGLATYASGFCSFATGQHTKAYARNSFAIGRYNIGGGDSINWVSTDPIFEIGIGSISADANALTIYKNGVAEFSDSLHTHGNINIGSGSGSRIFLGNTMMQSGGASILRMDSNVRPFTDNFYDLGSSNKRWGNIYATNAVIQTSDRRLKKDIRSLRYGLKDILQMKPVDYLWNEENNSDKRHLGLIAQELIELIPETVNQPDNQEEYLGVKYAELVPVLIKAIQEQNELIQDQSSTIDSQSSAIEDIKNEMVELKQLVLLLGEKQE